jgi:hypothetical protein
MFPQLWRWVPQLRFVCKHWQTLFLQHLPRDPELGEQDRVLLLRTANLEAPICAWKWVSDQLPLQCFAWDALMWYGQDAQARRVDQLKNRLNYCARVGATRAFLWLCSLAASPRLPLPRDPAHDEDAEGADALDYGANLAQRRAPLGLLSAQQPAAADCPGDAHRRGAAARRGA